VGHLRRVVAALAPPGQEAAGAGTGPGSAGLRQAARLVAPGGTSVDLPPALFAVLAEVARAMLAGRAVTVSPTSARLTTQEAADLLGVSRPTLVKLLDRGDIAHERPGRHRRVRLDDLLRYQDRQRPERRAALRELTRSAQDAGLYDTPAADYDDALHRARHADG
jgi:excisionase family DNA binding protein